MKIAEKIALVQDIYHVFETFDYCNGLEDEEIEDEYQFTFKSIINEDEEAIRILIKEIFEYNLEFIEADDYDKADMDMYMSCIIRLKELIAHHEADKQTISYTIRKEQYFVGGDFIDAEEVETYSTKEEAIERAKYLNRTQSEMWLVSPIKKGKGFAYTSFSVEATNSDGDLLDIDDVEIDLVELFKRTYPMKNHGIAITFEEDTHIFYDAHELTEPNGQLTSDILGIFKSVSSENDWSVDFKMLDYQWGCSLMDDDEIETFMAKAILNEA